MQLKEIQTKLTTYNLWETLLDRMSEVRVGGVKKVTCYKAFREGPNTEVLDLIISEAKRLVTDHESKHNIGKTADQKYPSATA
jgi:hypothetical protein